MESYPEGKALILFEFMGFLVISADGEMEKVVNDAGGPKNTLVDMKIHSQAGIILRNFSNNTSEDMCKCMHINTFGTAKVLENDRFGSVRNYIGVNDIVPMVADPITYMQARFFYPREDVIFLKSDTLPLVDHPFDGEAYQNANDYVNAKIRKSLKGI